MCRLSSSARRTIASRCPSGSGSPWASQPYVSAPTARLHSRNSATASLGLISGESLPLPPRATNSRRRRIRKVGGCRNSQSARSKLMSPLCNASTSRSSSDERSCRSSANAPEGAAAATSGAPSAPPGGIGAGPGATARCSCCRTEVDFDFEGEGASVADRCCFAARGRFDDDADAAACCDDGFCPAADGRRLAGDADGRRLSCLLCADTLCLGMVAQVRWRSRISSMVAAAPRPARTICIFQFSNF
eukprot:4296919-Prymnesium_polylepis.2